MQLQATVFCDCFERGRLLVQPHPEWHVEVDDTGRRHRSTPRAGADDLDAEEEWTWSACEHPGGKLATAALGSDDGIRHVRERIAPHAATFPILVAILRQDVSPWEKFVAPSQLEALIAEAMRLGNIQGARRDGHLRHFEDELRRMIEAALPARRPIAFW